MRADDFLDGPDGPSADDFLDGVGAKPGKKSPGFQLPGVMDPLGINKAPIEPRVSVLQDETAPFDFRRASAAKRAIEDMPKAGGRRGPQYLTQAPTVDQGFVDNASRVFRRVVDSVNQGTSGIVRNVGDITGIDAVSDFAKASSDASRRFANQTVAPKVSIDGFTPGSVVQDLPEATENALVSIGTQAPALASGSLPAALAIMFGQSYGDSYNTARDKELSALAAMGNAGGNAAMEVIGERIGGTPGTIRALRGAIAGNQPAQVAAELARAGIRDVPGELVTYVGQTGVNAAPVVGIGPAPTVDEFLEGGKDTVLQTILQGGIMQGAGTGLAAARRAAGGTPQVDMRAGVDAIMGRQPEPVAPPPTITPEQPAAQPAVPDQPAAATQAPPADLVQSIVSAIESAAEAAVPTPRAPAAQPQPQTPPATEQSADDFLDQVAQTAQPATTEPINEQPAAAPDQAGIRPIDPAPAPAGQATPPGAADTVGRPDAPVAQPEPEQQDALSKDARIGVDGIELTQGGRPYASKAEAKKAQKLQRDMRVVPVAGGFALAPKTDAQLKANAIAAKRLGGTGNKGMPMSVHEYLASRGGLAKATMSDLGFDRNMRIGAKWLFARNGGMTFEQAAEALQQAGYTRESDLAKVINLIQRSARYQPQYTPEGFEQLAQLERERDYQDYLEAQQEVDDDPFAPLEDMGFTEEDAQAAGFYQASPELQAEVAALAAQLEDAGQDAEAIMERIALQYPEATQQEYYERARQALADALTQATQPRGTGNAGQNDGSQTGQGAGRPADAEPAGQQRESQPADAEGLTSYTAEEVSQRLDRLEQAEKERERREREAEKADSQRKEREEVRQRSEAAADTFELGQDPVDNLTGQQDIFSNEDSGDTDGLRLFAPARATSAPGKMSPDAVRKALESALQGVPNPPGVEVVTDPAAAGVDVTSGIRPMGGTLPDGRILLFSDNIGSVIDVHKTVFHELFHRGAKVRFTRNSDYIAAMLDLAANDPAIGKAAREWKVSADGQDKRQQFEQRGRLTGDRLANYEALAVEEALAQVAENLPEMDGTTKKPMVQRIVKAMAKVADSLGMARLARWLREAEYSAAERFVMDTIRMSGGTTNKGTTAVLFKPDGTEPRSVSAAGQTLEAAELGPGIESIRTALSNAYGNLMTQLERRGLVTLTQTQDEAIAAAAEARAEQTGQDVELVRQSLMASVQNSLSPMKSIDANVRRGLESLAKALDERTTVHRAMFRNGLGWVDFVWGDDKKGLQHIIKRRQDADGMTEQEVIRFLQDGMVDVIASGTEVRRNEFDGNVRLVLEGDSAQAVLVRQKSGNNWVLTSFELKPGVEGRGATPASTTSVDAIRSRADGVAGAESMAQGQIAIKRSADGNVQGFYDPVTKKSFLVADNLTAEAAPGVLMHEVGVHMAGENQRFFDRADTLVNGGKGEFFDRVRARMEAAGETSPEEAAAYLAEEYERARTAAPKSVSEWVKTFLASIRAWLNSKGVLATEKLTAADIAAVARANARKLASGQMQPGDGGLQFSKRAAEEGGNQADDDQRQPGRSLNPFGRDELGRVKFKAGEAALAKLGQVIKPVLDKTGMTMASPELRRQLRAMKTTIEEANRNAAEVAKQMAGLSEADRILVSDIVEKTLKTGVVPPEHAVKVADAITKAMDRQTDELLELGMLTPASAERWRGRYLPRLYLKGEPTEDMTFWKRIFKFGGTMRGIRGDNLKARGLFETVSVDEAEQWLRLGWELRDPHWKLNQGKLELIDRNAPVLAREKVVVWRDWTMAERESMGEVRDAMLRYIEGYTAMQRDIAMGRLFNNIASNTDWVRRSPSEGWVPVPNTEIPNTAGVKRYGNLAGLFVKKDVMMHLSQFEEAGNDALQLWREALGLWKEGKTALNPVAHFNNVMSNISMAHFAGVSYWDGHKYVAAVRDLVNGDEKVEEARKAGLFTGSFTKEELAQSLPPELAKLMNLPETAARKAGRQVMNAITLWLRQPMRNAYEAEDTFFKYVIWRDARQRGMTSEEAADYALRYIFTYDDLPAGARWMRDRVIPFFAWTYKAIPALLHTAMVYPWRFLAPAAALHGINLAAYALAAGDEDDDWLEKIAKGRELEDQEREVLPDRMKGLSALGNPKHVRLGTDSLTGHPIYLDVSRVIPGGDMFDMENQAGGLPIPAPLMPNHPVLTVFSAMVVNKEMWMGKEVVDQNDTAGEAAAKRARWMAGFLLPAVAPGGYHSQRILDAAAAAADTVISTPLGDFTGIDRGGQPVQPKYAAMQTVGIKARPIDLELEADRRNADDSRLAKSIAAEVRSLARLHQRGAISDRAFEQGAERAREKMDRLRDE